MTYEAGIVENEDLPVSDDPVWLLGKYYPPHYDLEEVRSDVRSKLWLTYRKNFAPVGGTTLTSDNGWGCMLRCGQMVIGQALVHRHLGRDWIWRTNFHDAVHSKILRLFEDRRNAPYSIHQIAQMGVSEGKEVGQWFGPNTVAQVLRKLAVYEEWSPFAIHVAMDNTVIISEIKNQCKGHMNGVIGDGVTSSFGSRSQLWRPLILFIPLRVGLSEINPVYIRGLKTCFTLKQSLGIIGGKPNHASYFIGFVGNELIYLDPHTTQQFACFCHDSDCRGLRSEDSFHCKRSSRMDFTQLDPSVAVCFYCDSEGDFDDLCRHIQKKIIDQEKQPLFELCRDRPVHLPADDLFAIPDSDSSLCTGSALLDRKFDTSDDEFELL